jgi:hypothetical protein
MAQVASEKSLILPPNESLGEASRCKDKLGGRLVRGGFNLGKTTVPVLGFLMFLELQRLHEGESGRDW